jgi:branched-chain amino acid transport system ATP-binding protein
MLEIEGVCAGYGESTVVRDVSLVVPDASVVALLGPNGAGKTTLLRVASGLLRPRAGRIVVDGVDMTGRRPCRLVDAGVCLIPEGRGIFPSLSVRENLLLQVRRRDRNPIGTALDAFPRLAERMTQVAGTMSGGEQQMLALARAYLCSPKVVLLDEVSMGLAPRIVDEVFEVLARLVAQGVALLLVEQYIDRALALADYVHILNRGSLTFSGEPGELAGEDVFARYLGTEPHPPAVASTREAMPSRPVS